MKKLLASFMVSIMVLSSFVMAFANEETSNVTPDTENSIVLEYDNQNYMQLTRQITSR